MNTESEFGLRKEQIRADLRYLRDEANVLACPEWFLGFAAGKLAEDEKAGKIGEWPSRPPTTKKKR